MKYSKNKKRNTISLFLGIKKYYILDNLKGYKLVKEFTTSETNTTVEVFNLKEITKGSLAAGTWMEILTIASFKAQDGQSVCSTLKLAMTGINQRDRFQIYSFTLGTICKFSQDFYNDGCLRANVAIHNVKFQVYISKFIV